MGEYRQTFLVFTSTLALCALGLTWVAQAQTGPSPFAKKGQQAWESGTPTQSQSQSQAQPQPYQYPYGSGSPVPTNTPSTTGTYQPSGTLQAPNPVSRPATSSAPTSSYSYTLPKPAPKAEQAPPGYTAGSSAPSGTYMPQSSAASSSGGSPYPSTYYGGATPPSQASSPTPSPASGTYNRGSTYEYPSYNRAPKPKSASGGYYPGRVNGGQQAPRYGSQQAPRQAPQQAQGAYYPQNQYQGHYQGQNQNQTGTPNPYGTPQQPMRRSFSQKLGLNNVDFFYEGYVGGGAAGTYFGPDDEWREDFVLDGSVRAEVSAITPGGLEYGLGGRLRGQYDQYRRGFGGRVGDCPAGIAGCASTLDANGADVALRGHTSRFYAAGADDAKDFEAQLEGAYLFLRSAYGDVTVGRDDGAAYLFSLGAPSLLNVGASNSSVDYTGLDAVKTVNDASGFSEKITYTSPRLLGDQIGVGIQLGASYALDAEACGVDYCVRGNDDEPAGVIAPDIEDVIEAGLALDRKFANGLSVEATATYATGSQKSPIDAFDDLKALGLGLELGYGDFILGGSYLKSNNALADGDYKAMDVGLTWQPSKLGFTLGYGHAEDDNVGLTSDQITGGVSYDLNDMFRVSTGVQHVKRDVRSFDQALGLIEQEEDATSVFVEGRIKF